MNSKWTWKRLWKVLEPLAEKHLLSMHESALGDTFKHDHPSVRCGSEAILHEAFHSLLLTGEIEPSDTVGEAIYRLSFHESDLNEIKTLAAELVFTERLGLKLSERRLVSYAYANLRDEWDDQDTVVGEVLEFKTDLDVLQAVDALFSEIVTGGERAAV